MVNRTGSYKDDLVVKDSKHVILEITTGKTREIQVCDYEGNILAVAKYAGVSPVGHLITALTKLVVAHVEENGVDPVTRKVR